MKYNVYVIKETKAIKKIGDCLPYTLAYIRMKNYEKHLRGMNFVQIVEFASDLDEQYNENIDEVLETGMFDIDLELAYNSYR